MSEVRKRKADKNRCSHCWGQMGYCGCSVDRRKNPDAYISYHDDDTCPDCLGTMTWCDCCGMYSKYCCEEYGTCQCS